MSQQKYIICVALNLFACGDSKTYMFGTRNLFLHRIIVLHLVSATSESFSTWGPYIFVIYNNIYYYYSILISLFQLYGWGNRPRTVVWLVKLVSVRARNQMHVRVRIQGLLSFNSSSLQCLTFSVLPGVKVIRKDHKTLLCPYCACRTMFLTLYLQENPASGMIMLPFLLPSLLCRKNIFNYPGDAQIPSPCEISKQHYSLQSRKQILLGFLPHPNPTPSAVSGSTITNSRAYCFQIFFVHFYICVCI